MLVAHDLEHPAHDAFGGLLVGVVAEHLVGLQVRTQQQRILIEQLLVVGRVPVCRVRESEEAAVDDVVQRAFHHLVERQGDDFAHAVVIALLHLNQREVQRFRVGEFDAFAEAAVLVVELLVDRRADVVDHLDAQRVRRLRRAIVRLRPQFADPTLDVLLVSAPRVADAFEPHVQFGRVEEVVVRDQFAIRGQPGDGRPCTGAEALVDVGAAFAVDVHWDERVFDGGDDAGVCKARRHQVSAVLAPRSGDQQENESVFAGRARKRRRLEVLPLHGISHALLHPIGRMAHSAGVASKGGRTFLARG